MSSEPVWPERYDRILLDRVDSTSLEAARRASDLHVPTWIFAREQTAGRGRRGRAWSMPQGNFAASLIWNPGGELADHALRSFVASLALRDALTGLGVEHLSLKWPNDVLLKGRKLAGILLESAPAERLILGIGINLAATPDPAQLETRAVQPVALTPETGIEVSPEAMLTHLAAAFATREAQMVTRGFASIREDWLEHAAGKGGSLTARLPNATHQGIFEDVDGAGHLILRTNADRLSLAAADVFFEGETICS